MNDQAALKTHIHESIDQLQSEQLEQLWAYLEALLQHPDAPLYRVYEQAIETGVRDLAERHDYYLYGRE